MKDRNKVSWIFLIVVLAVAIAAVAIHAVTNPGGIDNQQQIAKMAQYLNDKYGYSVSPADCTYFREEDYHYQQPILDGGLTYDIPYIAIFQKGEEYITVTDRNGFLGDDHQLGELNSLLCEYYEEKTGLDIAFVEVSSLNAYLHHNFNEKLTAENIGEFVEGLLDSGSQKQLLFYFTAQEDSEKQLNQITYQLSFLRRNKNISSIRFYVTDMKELNIHYSAPRVHSQTPAENQGEYDEGYVWGRYHVVNSVEYHYPVGDSSYYQDVQHNTFLFGGSFQRSGSSGFGNRQIKQINNFEVVDLSDDKLSEYLTYMHSYGTWRDLTILMEVGMEEKADENEVTIGRERYQWTFQWATGTIKLYAFKHGSLIDLQTAWDCGYLSPDDMDKILQEHEAYLAQYNNLCVRFGVTAEEVAAQHKKFGKRTCGATIDNSFAAGRVLVLVYPFANDYSYSSADFEDVGCVDVEDLSSSLINPNKVSRILLLTLESATKQAVLDAIAILQQREDVYCAQPDYIYSIYN